MKSLLCLSVMLLAGCVSQEVVTKHQPIKGQAQLASYTGPVCLITGTPNASYTIIGKVLAIKQTYGDSEEMLKPLADKARHVGANAVMMLESSQRFRGVNVTRAVTPYARGVAIKIEDTFTCPGNSY